MAETTIQWTDRSVNPFRARMPDGSTGHYCRKLSSGCANCYSSRFQPRFGLPEFGGESDLPGERELYLHEPALQEVLRRRKPTKWFWWDMTDVGLDVYPDEWLDRCFAVMALTRQHTHQILTKRAGRLRTYLADHGRLSRVSQAAFRLGRLDETMQSRWPLPNVWIGASVENQAAADERIPVLLQIPAAVRFLSCEPLLGPADLTALGHGDQRGLNALTGEFVYYREHDGELVSDWGPAVGWVITGCESGPKRRRMDPEWDLSLQRQCQAAGVPFFRKQIEVNGRVSGDPGHWPDNLRIREFPHVHQDQA